MHCLEEIDVDLSQLLYYSYTALKCCHRHNSPSISNRHLCRHIPDIFLFFGCRYSCTGRSIQSREQRKFLVVYIQQIGNQNSTYALASFIGTHHSAWKNLRRPRFFVISALWESYRRAVKVNNRSFFITQINVVASNIQGTFLFSSHRSIFLPCDFEPYATTEFPDDNINKCAQCPLVELGPLNSENRLPFHAMSLRADLHGTTLSHATTAYDKPTTRFTIVVYVRKNVVAF